ncbi:hypothetical protein E2320_000736 [Naja naja]|nr:hypothetical protein E2320_000736 [Naja naja]
MSLRLLVASTLLLLLCSEALSYSVQKREAEEKTVLAQIQDTAKEYFDYVSDATTSWIDKVKSLDISQQVWNSYNNFISTVDTYKNIMTDQMLYFWHD